MTDSANDSINKVSSSKPGSGKDEPVIVIGAGTAGLQATKAAIKQGRNVILIEEGPGGTTCARVGCMPSKLLIAAAEHAHAATTAKPFGINVDYSIDRHAVMNRMKRERDRFVGFVQKDVDNLKNTEILRGKAEFAGDMKIEVNGNTINAQSIVLAVGSRPLIPPPLMAAEDRLIVSDDVFYLDELPHSAAVFGPGIIGLELGQALHRLGVRTTVFGLSGRIGPLTDPELKEKATEIFKEIMPVFPAISSLDIKRGKDVKIEWISEGRKYSESFEYVLAAPGRRSNLDRLKLENTGFEKDEQGKPVINPATLQIPGFPVFVAGDAAGIIPLLHEASDEGRLAGQNAASYPVITEIERRSPLSIVFTDPQMIMAGQKCSELTPDTFVTGRVAFENQGRSRVMLVNRGSLHVYADKKSGRLLGAEGIGPRLEHIAHLLAWCHQQNLTVHEMLKMPFYHPVIEEGLRTALRDAASQTGK